MPHAFDHYVDAPAPAPAQDADVIVIGAGPAGMSAAVHLAKAGQRVIVLDMQPTPGGQVFRGLEANLAAAPATNALLAALGPSYLAGRSLIERFRSTPGIDFRPDHTVWELRSDGTVGWKHGDHAGYLRAPQILLANGAMERPAPFPGWTLPGVMTAGAVQTLLKAGRMQPAGRVVLAGTGPLIFLLADQLRRLGVKPVLLARTDRLRDKIAALPALRLGGIAALLKGMGWMARLRLAGIPFCSGITGLAAVGPDRLTAVRLTRGQQVQEIACDLLVVHDGIIPATDLAQAAGLQLDWHAQLLAWQPKTKTDGRGSQAPGPQLADGPCRIRVSGDARRIGGADAAIAHGAHAAAAILANGAGGSDSAVLRSLAGRAFLDRAFPPGLAASLPEDRTILCRCEEITAGTLRQRIRDGAQDINDIRGTTRCGMGPCQGRNCTISLARLIAEATGTAPLPFRGRPPVHPITLGALATLANIDPRLSEIISLDDKPEALATEAADV